MSSRIDYGIDAPGLVRIFWVGGALSLAACSALYLWLGRGFSLGLLAEVFLFIIALYMIFMGCLMIYYSKVTKLTDRDLILNQISWRGDEHVLDVGCGRGLMLIGAAKKLKTGKAVGVDIWAAKDQSGNSAEGTLTNARLEGVANRIEIHTADMKKLPFPDAAFDVIVSSWAVHNLDDVNDRNIALAEMKRVLKHGGAILLSDIVNREEYAREFAKLGFKHIRLVFNPIKDQFLRTISFGSFGPVTLVVS